MTLKIRGAAPSEGPNGDFPAIKAVGFVRAVRVGDRHMDSYVELNNNRVRVYCDADEAELFVELRGQWVEAKWHDYKLKYIRNARREWVYQQPAAKAS